MFSLTGSYSLIILTVLLWAAKVRLPLRLRRMRLSLLTFFLFLISIYYKSKKTNCSTVIWGILSKAVVPKCFPLYFSHCSIKETFIIIYNGYHIIRLLFENSYEHLLKDRVNLLRDVLSISLFFHYYFYLN
jgi:putative effector of murein hydrolase